MSDSYLLVRFTYVVHVYLEGIIRYINILKKCKISHAYCISFCYIHICMLSVNGVLRPRVYFSFLGNEI